MTGRVTWPAEHAGILAAIFIDTNKRQWIADMLNAEFGTAYTIDAVRAQAHKMGLKRQFGYDKSAWTVEDVEILRAGRRDGRPYSKIAAAFGGRFDAKACATKGRDCGMIAPIRSKVKQVKKPAPPPPPMPVARSSVEEKHTVEPAPLPIGADGIMAASFRYILGWCLWAGFTTNGTDIDTRVNVARRFMGRAPFVVVA
jgi:hypothetical protein